MPPIYRLLYLDPLADREPPKFRYWRRESAVQHHLWVTYNKPPTHRAMRNFYRWMMNSRGYCVAWLASGAAFKAPAQWPTGFAEVNPLRLPTWMVAEADLPPDLKVDQDVLSLMAWLNGMWLEKWYSKFDPRICGPEPAKRGLLKVNQDIRVHIALASRYVRYLPAIRIADEYVENLRLVQDTLQRPFALTDTELAAWIESEEILTTALSEAVKAGYTTRKGKPEFPPGWRRRELRVTVPPGGYLKGFQPKNWQTWLKGKQLDGKIPQDEW